MCYEELYQESRPEHFEAELAAEMAQNDARTPIWCKVLSFNDLCVGAGLSERYAPSIAYDAAMRAVGRQCPVGWATPAWIVDALTSQTDEAKAHPEFFQALAGVAHELPDDTLVLLNERDAEHGTRFREHYQPLQTKRSRPRPPRAATLLREFLARNGDQPVRGIHEVILPKDDGLWAAVVFGDIGEMLGEVHMLQVQIGGAAGYGNDHHDHAFSGLVSVSLWRFKTLKDQRKFIAVAQQAVDQILKSDGLNSEEYFASLAADAPSI